MTATNPPAAGAGQPAVQPQSSAAAVAGGVGARRCWSPPGSRCGWTALYYALGRRLLPIMAARWAFNGGTALALALGLAR